MSRKIFTLFYKNWTSVIIIACLSFVISILSRSCVHIARYVTKTYGSCEQIPTERDVFDHRSITWNLFWLRSPDLTPCEFYYIRESIKNKMQRTNPYTLERLKDNVHQEICSITREVLHRVVRDFLPKCQNLWMPQVKILNILIEADQCF